MGLPIDEIHFCVTRIRHHLHLLVTQNPIPFAVFFFMLILYAFLPCVFRVLLHCFPVLVMVTLAVVFSLDRRASHGAALNVNVNAGESSQENNGFPESPMCQSGEKTYKRAHSVRRRNARLSKDRFNNIATPQEKDAVAAAAASATADDDAVDKPETSTAATTTTTTMSEEKKGKEILRVDKRVEKLRRGNNKEDEHEDDEEKNSMDIAGLSEAERTTRLESLMAKRRARKMLSIQLRKALVKMGKNDPRAQFASILIPKSIPNAPTSPIPVEAPCVLFPSRNPFDIPYDSHEEKPNLSADDFDKEFVANQTNPPHQDPNTDAIFIPSSSSSNPEPTLHNIEPENTNLHEDEHERGPETISQDVSSIEDKGSGSGSGSGSKRSKEVQEFREQDIMDVVFSGLEPILEQDLDESDPSMTNISINMRNHDHEIDKRIQESRKGKAIVEDNSTSEADDIPYNNGKEIIDYIKETYDDEQQRSNQPSSSSSSSTCNNQNNNGVPVPITDQNQRDPFAASSSHSNNNEEQQDVQQEMVVGEGSYDSSSSSSTSSSSTTTHDKLIQTDQPTNEMPPKHDQSESSSMEPASQSSTMEDSTRFNLEIGTGQTSTQETIPCSTEEIEVIKEDEADSDEINKKEI